MRPEFEFNCRPAERQRINFYDFDTCIFSFTSTVIEVLNDAMLTSLSKKDIHES